MKFISLVILFIVFLTFIELNAQIKGKESKDYNPDTVYVYNSPRQLINYTEVSGSINNVWGLDLLFSGSGFGLGLFYQTSLVEDLFFFSSLYISGARNSDEFELYDWNTGKYYIKDKINRIFNLPLTIGLQNYFFKNILNENLKPYLNVGIGPSFIISSPYNEEFFKSFSSSNAYTRFAAFLGAGANVGAGSNSFISVNIRYYFIPFGGNGLESIKNNPISDFGGLFLSLSLGAKF